MPETVVSQDEAQERLFVTRQKMAEALKKAGRTSGEVTLLGVSKTFPAQSVLTYFSLGLTDFGESYIQEAKDKVGQIPPGPIWHFIGHLQTNKAKYAVRYFSVLHALDSLDLAAELDKKLSTSGKTMTVYIQVNVSGEESKSGLEPDFLPEFLDNLSQFSSLVPIGLMTMPPYDPDPEVSRPFFRRLYELKEKKAPTLSGLSMGMSGDYEVAISEGSTIIRVGTALFGARQYL